MRLKFSISWVAQWSSCASQPCFQSVFMSNVGNLWNATSEASLCLSLTFQDVLITSSLILSALGVKSIPSACSSPTMQHGLPTWWKRTQIMKSRRMLKWRILPLWFLHNSFFFLNVRDDKNRDIMTRYDFMLFSKLFPLWPVLLLKSLICINTQIKSDWVWNNLLWLAKLTSWTTLFAHINLHKWDFSIRCLCLPRWLCL